MKRIPAKRENRIPVRNLQLVRVTVAGGPGQLTSSDAVLGDISRGGAKLKLDQPLPFQDHISILLQSPELGLKLTLAARVCWVRQEPEGDWLVGCTFEPELPKDSLEKLFVSGLLERRLFPRKARRTLVSAKWELDAQTLPAYLWDVSEGGFCILSPQTRQVGRRVLITIEHQGRTEQVQAETHWQAPVAGGYVVGCQFINREGCDLLRELTELQTDAPASSRRSFKALARQIVGGLLTARGR